jgi:hypothetical protein
MNATDLDHEKILEDAFSNPNYTPQLIYLSMMSTTPSLAVTTLMDHSHTPERNYGTWKFAKLPIRISTWVPWSNLGV